MLRYLCLFSILLSAPATIAQTLDQRLELVIKSMTLEEKILQLHHEGGFNTADNQRLGLGGFIMADGPHGVRDGLATAFPVGITMAASWDTELIYRVGAGMGREFLEKGKNQALGPCMDLTRDPRNGRSPESGGEDPVLNAAITTALVKGLQSTGVIATAKHFNAVNRQTNRTNNNVIISKKRLMDQYGLNFRSAVQNGGAFSVMNAYNLINGEKCAENTLLLTGILRQHWGFPFYVVSDWGSIWSSEKAIEAGCNVDMGDDHYQNELLNLVRSGTVSEAVIDDAVLRVLRTKYLTGLADYFPGGNQNTWGEQENRSLALEAAEESVVLLRNAQNLLPLDEFLTGNVALIGPSADVARLDGTGSSYVTPYFSVSPLQAFSDRLGSERVSWAKGCDINSSNTAGFSEALSLAAAADVVIFFGGLDETQEGEGLDRVTGSIDLPGKQADLINQLSLVNDNLIVVMESGGIVGLQNCIENIHTLLYAFYPGQEGGSALANIIFGDVNPSGKLPVTMPKNDGQLPLRNDNFNDDHGCGYRWFDYQDIQPQFAFGHGLSYTDFTYSNISIWPDAAEAGQPITIEADLTNSGNLPGAEVVQLYISSNMAQADPAKELKGFRKIFLAPGESKRVSFLLQAEDFYSFDEYSDTYDVPEGLFSTRIGGASDKIDLVTEFTLTANIGKPDLAIASVYAYPPYPVKGDSVLFLATVKNLGNAPSPQGVIHSLTFRINEKFASQSTGHLQSIPPGGMTLISADACWPVSESGDFELSAAFDEANFIAEWRDDNNSSSKIFSAISTIPKNIAVSALIYASSKERDGLEAIYAVDGLRTTRWSSQFSDPQWIFMDFGEIRHFDRINLVWENAYGKHYRLQYSGDGSDWTTLQEVMNGDGGIDRFDYSAEARYVMMYGLERGTEWGYSLYEFEVFDLTDTTGANPVEPGRSARTGSLLFPNYPNPFNPATTIEYELAGTDLVSLKIYNLSGQEIAVLVNGEQHRGRHKVIWNGNNRVGQTVASGVYIYVLRNGRTSLQRKMLLLR